MTEKEVVAHWGKPTLSSTSHSGKVVAVYWYVWDGQLRATFENGRVTSVSATPADYDFLEWQWLRLRLKVGL